MSNETDSSLGAVLTGVILIVVLNAVIYYLTAAQLQGDGMVRSGSSSAVVARIKPVGQVEIASADTAVAAAVSAEGASSAAAGGEAIYGKACIACHATGAAGAPKLGDKAAWEPRIAQGIDVMLQTAINGKNAMPPRGTCGTCSDDDLKAAIEYMVSKAE